MSQSHKFGDMLGGMNEGILYIGNKQGGGVVLVDVTVALFSWGLHGYPFV